MSNWMRRAFGWALASAVFVMILAGVAMAATTTPASSAPDVQLAGKVTALPNPPGYPENDVFLVTLVHGHQVPAIAVIHFASSLGQHTTSSGTFKKVNHYQYETVWSATAGGYVHFQAYTAHHQLVAEASYPVRKGHANSVGRIFIGALFIGGSLWFWWRQQRFSRNH